MYNSIQFTVYMDTKYPQPAFMVSTKEGTVQASGSISIFVGEHMKGSQQNNLEIKPGRPMFNVI